MSGKEERLSARLQHLPSLALPDRVDFTRAERAVEALLKRLGRPEKRRRENGRERLRALQRRIQFKDWRKCPLRRVMQAADHAFGKDFGADSEFDDVRQFLLRELEVTDVGGFINPMVRIYIETFNKNSRWSRELAAILERRKVEVERVLLPGWRRFLKAVPVLFDPARAPQQIAHMMVQMQHPWEDLHAFGLPNPHAAGLMEEVHQNFVELMKDRLDQPEEIDRMVNWLKPEEHSGALETGAAPAIEALLAPWEKKDAPPDVVDKLTKSLIHYGHPSARVGFVWEKVDEKYKKVFLRWLLEADYKLLLKVLDERGQSHMWGARREFWQDLLEKGNIQGLWVAFDNGRYEYAKKFLPKERFGCQVIDDSQRTSLLLIDIKGKIVVEGTNSFAMRIFSKRDPNCPKLYQATYDLKEMRRFTKKKIEHRGKWQATARKEIFK